MYQRRLQVIAGLYALVIFALIGRLFQLQVVRGEYYRQRTEERILDIRQVPSWRGTITDRNGDVLALDQLSWDLSVIFDEYDGAATALHELRLILGIPRRTMRKPLAGFLVAPYVEALSDEGRAKLGAWAREALSMEESPALAWLGDPRLELATLIEDIVRIRQEAVLYRLAAELGTDPDLVRAHIDDTRDELQSLIDKRWETARVWTKPQGFLRNLLPEQARAIELHHESLPGIVVTSSLRRAYPERDAVAHIIGYANRINAEEYAEFRRERETFEGFTLDPVAPDSMIGRKGLERFFEDTLRGKDGVELVERDAHGTVHRVIASRPPESGGTVELTLDLVLQNTGIDSFRRRGFRGSLVALDVNTGEVLALVSWPSYDNNWFIPPTRNEEIKDLFQDTPENKTRARAVNRATAAMYPPGSVIKIFMSLAGLDSGAISPAHLEHCAWGATSPYGHKMCEGVHYDVDLQKAIQRSCNIFFYNLGVRMGIDKMHEYLTRYGLGRTTDIECGDSAGLVGSPGWKRARFNQTWYPAETEDMAIGQGFLTVSPLQVARFMAAVANGGKLYPSSLVKTVNGEPAQHAAPENLRFDTTSLQLVRRGMYLVTHQEGGTAFRSGISEFGAVGKTGTAQVQGKEPHAWFAGYAPFENPKIAFAVVVENAGHGGDVAAPIAKEFLREYFKVETKTDETTDEHR